jgi:hypothetical protein
MYPNSRLSGEHVFTHHHWCHKVLKPSFYVVNSVNRNSNIFITIVVYTKSTKKKCIQILGYQVHMSPFF